MKRLVITLLFAGVAVGCTGDVLTRPTEGPVLSHARGAGCQGVEFEAIVPLATLVGTVSGDLVGTITPVFGPGVIHGAVFMNEVIDVIDVASATVPGLAGKTLVYRHDDVFVQGAPGLGLSPRVNEHGTVVGDGVTGHLTTNGHVDFGAPLAAFFTYRGNICVASG